MKPVPDEEEPDEEELDEEELEGDSAFDYMDDWQDEPNEIIIHYDAAGHAHCEDGPAADLEGKPVWYWHGYEFYRSVFREDWPDDKKAWWMRAKLEGAT